MLNDKLNEKGVTKKKFAKKPRHQQKTAARLDAHRCHPAKPGGVVPEDPPAPQPDEGVAGEPEEPEPEEPERDLSEPPAAPEASQTETPPAPQEGYFNDDELADFKEQ